MSVGSTVSLVWGIQVDTVPLLLSSQCYKSYHEAEIFFALLSLRIRTNTLRLELNSSSLLPQTSVASLPLEVTDMILEELFGTLYSERRSALLERVGRCCCSVQREEVGGDRERHECGIDCRFWLGCCTSLPPGHFHPQKDACWNEYQSDARHEYWHSLGRETSSDASELLALLRSFNLQLTFIHTSWVNWDERVRPLVVGIPSHTPFLDVPPLPTSITDFHPPKSVISKPHHSLVLPDEDVEFSSAVTSIPTIKSLSDEEKKRFARLFKVLRLDKAEVDTDKARVATKALEGEGKGEREGITGEERETNNQPSLLLVHFSWCWE